MKKHFYRQRIKALSFGLVLFVIGLVAVGVSKVDWKSINPFRATTTATIAFAPFAFVKKLKDDKKWDALDDNTKTYMTTLETELNKAFEETQRGILTPEEFKKKHDEWMKDYGTGLTKDQLTRFTEMSGVIKTLGEELQRIKDQGLGNEEAVSDFMKQYKARVEDMKKWQAAKAGVFKIEFKTQVQQAPGDIATHTIGVRVPGIGQLPVRKPFMEDLFPSVNCNLEYIRYIDQETVVRDAKWVATAAASNNLTKLTWKERSIQITNVRDKIDIPINMLEDYDFVEGEVRRLLDTSVSLKVDNGLLKGVGAANEVHGVAEYASEFDATNTLGGTITPWNGTIQSPNIFDLVIAMTSQIIALGQDGSFIPNVVLFNTIDRYKAMLIKDKNDNYLMPPFVVRNGNKEYTIDGMMVRSNPNVDANSCWVFDSLRGTIYNRKAAVAEMSFENASNFETEVVTLKVYRRLNLLVRNVDANAFMKCTDVQTALTALAA